MTHIAVRQSGSVWYATLDRADKRNALTTEMIEDLHGALDAAEDADATVLVLAGNGSMFCAGADIAGYQNAADDPTALRIFTERARGLCTRLTESPVIIVTVAAGSALGGGFELVLASDIVVSMGSARFGLPELRLGLIPGWGGTQRLPAHVGVGAAKRAILLGETFTAAELQESGLISAVANTAEELDSFVDQLVARLSSSAPVALRAAKQAITLAVAPTGADAVGLIRERDLLLDLFDTEDGREGVLAFVEKRPPVWIGS